MGVIHWRRASVLGFLVAFVLWFWLSPYLLRPELLSNNGFLAILGGIITIFVVVALTNTTFTLSPETIALELAAGLSSLLAVSLEVVPRALSTWPEVGAKAPQSEYFRILAEIIAFRYFMPRTIAALLWILLIYATSRKLYVVLKSSSRFRYSIQFLSVWVLIVIGAAMLVGLLLPLFDIST